MPNRAPSEFLYVTDRYDLRARDAWWVYFDEATAMHIAVKNPHLEPDVNEDTGSVFYSPTHEGVFLLPEFPGAGPYWTYGWHVPILVPTILADDTYDEAVYDALREADFSD